jgi:beta-lactamase superfamily II metal-dependent hydrolase
MRSSSVLALATVLAWPLTALAGDLQIHHLDIEQGDSTLVVSPDGHALLIDAGPQGMGSSRVVPRLKALGITSLDYTVASHYHADHIGGLPEVMKSGFRPIVAYDRGAAAKPTQTYPDYVAAAGAQRRAILPGETFKLGAEVVVECVAVNGTAADGQKAAVAADDENGLSIVLVIRYRNFDYYVGGDLTAGGLGTTDVESLLGSRVRDLDVYRVSHHGSNTGTSAEFLARTQPEVAII